MDDFVLRLRRLKKLHTQQTSSTQLSSPNWTLPGVRLTAKQAKMILDNEMLHRMQVLPTSQWNKLYDILSQELEKAHADVDVWYDPYLVEMTPTMLASIKKAIACADD